MALEEKRLRKPARKLRKFLKKAPKQPKPEVIHDLRTNSRRWEASLEALSPASQGKQSGWLKDLGRLRKRAGRVRDMDVLTGYMAEVHADGEPDCTVQLLEHLGAERRRHTKKLYAAVQRYGPKLRKHLKRSSAHFEKLLRKDDKRSSQAAATAVAATALKLTSDLASPARLGRMNLHPYRLKVKELRNVLQMAQDADDQEFVETLGEVKDAIGEWHDWEELLAMAAEVLDHGPQCRILRELRRTSEAKYERALALAEQMRRKYLRVGVGTAGRKKKPASLGREPGPAKPVWSATAAIAA